MDKETERVFHDVTLENLIQIRQYVRETAVSQGCELSAISEFIVAVNEAVANIIRHGYRDKSGYIKVQVKTTTESVKVTLSDNSPSFDPTSVISPDINLPLEERPFGGMGVHMMREFCDELSYRRNENDENELILIKRLTHSNRLDQS